MTLKIIKDKINNAIEIMLDDTLFILKEARDKLSVIGESDTHDFIQLVSDTSTILLNKLRESSIPAIMDAVLKANIEQIYQQYIYDIESSLDIFNSELVFFEKRDGLNTPPVSKFSRIVMKDIVQEDILIPLLDKHLKSYNDLHERIEHSFRSISEIDQIVDYNIKAAIGYTEETETKINSVKMESLVIDGLDRASNQVLELKKGFEKLISLSEEYLSEMTVHLATSIRYLSDNNKFMELTLRLTRARTRKNIREIALKVLTLSSSKIRSIVSHLSIIFQKVKNWYRRARKITGFEEISPDLETELMKYMTETRQRLDRLPYVYRRLFSLKPLSDRRFFSSRIDEMNILKDTLDLWKTGKSLSVALIGERGSGKTTFLDFAQTDIMSDFIIIRINIEQTILDESELLELFKNKFGTPDAISLEDIENMLIASDVRKICICENIHYLFLRTVNGFDAIERFVLFIQRTENSVFWIVSCALYGWNYLNLVMHISRYFASKIELGMEKQHEIEETILKRHRVSGYVLEFAISDTQKKTKYYKKLNNEEQRHTFAREYFFNQLANITYGNMRVVLLYWLIAIKEITKEKMVISPEIKFDHAFVYQLPHEELFTLAAIIHHESLSSKQHASIFHQNIISSRLILNRMESIGFLERTNDIYSIHPFLYRPVVKALQTKNILQ